MKVIEICTSNMASVSNAVAGGARRIELCSALALDGLTPSLGTLQWVRQRFPALTIHVLIRPREGNFVYDVSELHIMEADIRAALPYADGIVVGALTPQGHIDLPAMQALVRAAGDKPVTFHRAFDRCAEPIVAMEQLIGLGCKRILTSGQQPTAEQGIPLLRRLADLADGRIIIMPGGGVTPLNASRIVSETGVSEIHASCTAGTDVSQTAVVQQLHSISLA